MIASGNGDFFSDCCNFLCNSCFLQLDLGVLCGYGTLIDLKASLITQCKQAGYCSKKWSKFI